MRRALIILLGLAGCDRVFLGDRGQPLVDLSVSRERAYVTTQVETLAFDPPGWTAVILMPDGRKPTGFSEIAMSRDDAGVFHARISDTDRLVKIDEPGQASQIFALAATDLVVRDVTYAHPDPELAPPNAQVQLGLTLDRPYNKEALALFTVGAWMQRPLVGAELPAVNATTWNAPPVAYASLATVDGKLPQRLRPDDDVLVLRYAGSVLDGMFSAPGYVQRDGVDSLTGTMQPVMPQPFSFQLDPAGARQRIDALRSPMVVMGWNINAAPGGSVGAAHGPTLASAPISSATPTIMARFANPFAALGWPTVLAWSTTGRRMSTGDVRIPLEAVLSQQVEVIEGETPVLSLLHGLPLLISIDGTPVARDGSTVAITGDAPVTLEMTLDGGTCDRYSFNVYEIDRVSGTRTLRFQTTSRTHTITIPGALFAPATLYVARAACEIGVPELAVGHTGIGLPYGVGALDSAVFSTP